MAAAGDRATMMVPATDATASLAPVCISRMNSICSEVEVVTGRE